MEKRKLRIVKRIMVTFPFPSNVRMPKLVSNEVPEKAPPAAVAHHV